MSSFALTLSGTSSELNAEYYPPIELDKDGQYVCGLIDFQTFMSIPNINKSNNKVYFERKFNILVEPGIYSLNDLENVLINHLKKFEFPQSEEFTKKFARVITDPKNSTEMISEYNYPELLKHYQLDFENHGIVTLMDKMKFLEIDNNKEISKLINNYSNYTFYRVNYDVFIPMDFIDVAELPVGSYEIEDIEKAVTKLLINKLDEEFYEFSIFMNKITLDCEIESTHKLVFNGRDTFATVLGFTEQKIIFPNNRYASDNIIKLSRVNVIKIECNIIEGSYSNDDPTHTLHEFYPTVGIGYKIVEVPSNVIYLPLTVRTIRNLSVKLIDQENNLIDFRNEEITLRIHIKKI